MRGPPPDLPQLGEEYLGIYYIIKNNQLMLYLRLLPLFGGGREGVACGRENFNDQFSMINF